MNRQILAKAPVRAMAIFLDFDGCLVDLAARPQDVVVPRSVPPVLTKLVRRTGGAVALVSGRSVSELRRFLPGVRAMFCGSHGAERGGMAGPVTRHAVDKAALERAYSQAAEAMAGAPGLLAERKPVGIGLHYRGAPDRRDEIFALAERLLRDLPGFHAHHGKMVVELRPDGIGKGHALIDLMAQPRFRGRMPVMFGDDNTDEPAFEAANRQGGLSVKVGAGPTAARFRVGSPAEVRRLLANWAGRCR